MPARRLELEIISKKTQRTWYMLDFAVLANHREKIKENKKRDGYLIFAWE